MADLKKLLDALVAGASEPAAGVRQSAPENGLADIFAELSSKLRDAGSKAGVDVDDLPGLARDVFGQATDGVREGASDLGRATGIGDAIGDLARQISGGRDANAVLAQVKDLARDNPLATGAIIGGLGSLLLGTRSGRSVTTGAAKLGGAVLIGGLAYKAWQNYQQGRPLMTRSEKPEPAPVGSGFETAAISETEAALYIKAMIAAASSDGAIDRSEKLHLLDSLKKLGLADDNAALIEAELQNPASPQVLAAMVDRPQQAAQLYMAARLAIDPDTAGEISFLDELARELNLDDGLRAQIDAAAASVRS